MDKDLRNRFLFSLCVAQINNLYESLRKSTTEYSTEAESAWLSLADHLMAMACGAAVESGIDRESTDPLVTLMDNLRLCLKQKTRSHVNFQKKKKGPFH